MKIDQELHKNQSAVQDDAYTAKFMKAVKHRLLRHFKTDIGDHSARLLTTQIGFDNPGVMQKFLAGSG